MDNMKAQAPMHWTFELCLLLLKLLLHKNYLSNTNSGRVLQEPKIYFNVLVWQGHKT